MTNEEEQRKIVEGLSLLIDTTITDILEKDITLDCMKMVTSCFMVAYLLPYFPQQKLEELHKKYICATNVQMDELMKKSRRENLK